LNAFNATTGQVVFNAPHQAQWERYYAPTIDAGTVYVNGGTYGGMYAFDAFTGVMQWFQPLNQYDEWTPALDASLAYAYLGEYQPGLFAVDRRTGARVFFVPDPDFRWSGWSMHLAPVVGAMNDVLVISGGRLISFDTANRQIRWQQRAQFSGQPAVARGVIYAFEAGSLSARDEATGTELWRWRPPTQFLGGTMIVTDSHVLAHTADVTYAIDINARRAVWSVPISGHLTLADDTLYIAAPNGTLFALDTGTLAATGPRLDIKANGSDEPIVVRRGQTVSVTIALDPASTDGRSADVWVSAQTGTFTATRSWFVLGRGWVSSATPLPAFQGALMRVMGHEVLRTTQLPFGQTVFTFAVDAPDGAMTATIFDSVVVTVQ
jgi:outer membrane protein assembly factor BamB